MQSLIHGYRPRVQQFDTHGCSPAEYDAARNPFEWRQTMSTRATLFLVTALSSAGAFAQDIGRVTSVTLYPGSATVERAVRVTAGSGRVELTGLPASFDVRTLRVEGDPGIRIGEVAVQDVARADALSAREADLENRIQALKDEKASLDV